jgi:hypothetical protein
MKLLAPLLLLIHFAACGGAPQKHAAQAAPASTDEASESPAMLSPDHRAEIESLAQKIAELRQSAGLPESVRPQPEAAPAGEVSRPEPVHCEASSEKACQDTCELRSAICEAAESICGLAADLPGDLWAQEKCQNGRASCAEAEELCCACGIAP